MARDTRLDEARGLYAQLLQAASGSTDPRIGRAFDGVPREAFLPPGPWTMIAAGKPVRTPSDDPALLYQNVLVALDRAHGVNTGEPQLHASWIGAVAPQPGETVTQIGAGMGYYTAILAMLVLPSGKVVAYEVNPALAEAARRNLVAFEAVEVRREDGAASPLPFSDVIYVNAGVTAPPVAWLDALAPGGRIVFPWRPSERVGLGLVVTRLAAGFSVRVLGPAWFIPCLGACDPARNGLEPDAAGARRAASLWLRTVRQPDASAVAIHDAVWFSDEPIS